MAICILGIMCGGSNWLFQRSAGPNFRLTGPAGQIYTRASFPSDSVLVIYFGFTTCWRACPTALNAIAQAMEDSGEARKHIQPIFISLDSQREGLDVIELYLKAFGPEFIGLRGSQNDVQAAAAEFGVSAQRIEYSGDPGDYTMVHSSPIFVLAPRRLDPLVIKPDSSAAEIRAFLSSVLTSPAG
jgi:protein SCO1/2